ncbi:hypothetical protein BFJ72_g9286 [Fusarium proliferatum]|uniref:Uncharacterized protein n=1 Tax=Gibberella intermedia TaxID=948311 RepID=A0A420SZ79_GIBIN|nr:hypothetical protein BFJ72_g9286 [Fusarium proliferatum]
MFTISKHFQYFMLKLPDGSIFAQINELACKGIAESQKVASIESIAFVDTKLLQHVFSRAKKPSEATLKEPRFAVKRCFFKIRNTELRAWSTATLFLALFGFGISNAPTEEESQTAAAMKKVSLERKKAEKRIKRAEAHMRALDRLVEAQQLDTGDNGTGSWEMIER